MEYGKTLFAKEFAKMILCLDTKNKPCGNCKSCIELGAGSTPDLIEILPQNGTIKIEQIRKMRRKNTRKTNNIKQKSIYNKRRRPNDKRGRKLFTKNLRRATKFHNNNTNRFK